LQDPELYKKLTTGDAGAFKLLYEQNGAGIYRVCLRFLNNQAEAEDAVQEIFIKAYQSIALFRGQAKLSTWLYRIAVNYCLNQQRKNRWRSWLTLEFLDDRHSTSVEIDENPQQRLESDETERIVQKAIQALPERQRMALVLCHYEQKSYLEISELMNCSLSAVESCVHHAKKNLSISLKKIFKY
jgi:RNA polymerase sigma-70 factor, ECF subfamily